MSFDPLQEDCHRLILETLRRNSVSLSDNAYVSRCIEAYELDAASLIANDRDRSFHLVAKVVEAVDYRIPFITDDAKADAEADAAENMIAEAAALDPQNWDAIRIQAALSSETSDAYLAFMLEHVDEVAAATTATCANTATVYDRELSGDLAKRPYLRWLNAIASRLLIAGCYRRALAFAEKSLAFEPTDPGNVAYTALLAASKLEYSADELKRFRSRHQLAFRSRGARRLGRHAKSDQLDAWSLISELNAHYRALDYSAATATLETLLRTYPHAADACYFQTEFPDGIYARVNVVPGSTDELVLALSEATPLLQEGLGTPDSAAFSLWLQDHELVQKGIDRKLIHSIEETRNRFWGEQ